MVRPKILNVHILETHRWIKFIEEVQKQLASLLSKRAVRLFMSCLIKLTVTEYNEAKQMMKCNATN